MKKKKTETRRQQRNERVEPTRTKSKRLADEVKREKWLAIRKREGRKIDPETAEVDWKYAQTLDPYGVYPELSEECALAPIRR